MHGLVNIFFLILILSLEYLVGPFWVLSKNIQQMAPNHRAPYHSYTTPASSTYIESKWSGPLFHFDRIRILIRILLLVKVMRICHPWSADHPRLHCERLWPSMAPFRASTAPEFWLWCRSGSGSSFSTLMRIRIRLSKITRIRIPIRNTGCQCRR